jgi:hypothetical protein
MLIIQLGAEIHHQLCGRHSINDVAESMAFDSG